MLLTRFAYHSSCTLGWMSVGELRLATLERPWLPNPLGPGGQTMVSCVPEGRYDVLPHDSSRYPQTYALRNHTLGVYYLPKHVPAGQRWGRTAILIHAGTTVSDVVGCIAVGLDHATAGEQHCISETGLALSRLRERLGRGNATLEIVAVT
jgi:hypothetical protein